MSGIFNSTIFNNQIFNIGLEIIPVEPAGGFAPSIYRPLRWVKILETNEFNTVTIIVHTPKHEKRSIVDILGQVYWTPETNSRVIVLSDIINELQNDTKIMKELSNYLASKGKIGLEYVSKSLMPMAVDLAGDIANSNYNVTKIVKEYLNSEVCKDECKVKHDLLSSVKRNKTALMTLEEIIALVKQDEE